MRDDALTFPKQIRQEAAVKYRELVFAVSYREFDFQFARFSDHAVFDHQTTYPKIAILGDVALHDIGNLDVEHQVFFEGAQGQNGSDGESCHCQPYCQHTLLPGLHSLVSSAFNLCLMPFAI